MFEAAPDLAIASETVVARCPGEGSRRPCVRLSVSDTGPGVSPELRGRIFERYFTAGKRGRRTGLGLSIVQAIVPAHAGWMELESEPGAGACFSAFFPR